MNVGSLFSGVGGLDLGLARAGFRHRFFCESDEWRRSVLAYHWPGVPVYDDVRDVGIRRLQPGRHPGADVHAERRESVPELDLLCGGFPCQDLSVAGQRRGLAGERSGLFHEFARIIDLVRPRWVLIENVPGLLSSNGGRDFGIVLGTLADLGYGVAWRILDSRFFGVPQRRRRVFILGARAHGDPRAAAERAGQVLAVGSRCPRHPATRGEKGQDVAGTLGGGAGERGWAQDTERMTFVASTLKSQAGKGGSGIGPEHTFVAAPLSHGSNPNSNMAGRRREDDVNFVELGWNWQTGGDFRPMFGEQAPALQKNQTTAVGVRRLTPVECERLQAWPDQWTNPHGDAPDSRRYAACGDGVTASVAEWIGRRLMTAPAEDGEPHRKETETSVPSP